MAAPAETAAATAAAMPAKPVALQIELGGGVELLFGKRKRLAVELASRDGTVGMRELLAHLRDRELKERPELFMQKDTIRPGILVLINEADWELDGGIDAKVKSGDTVTFISTLHGG